MKGADVGKIAFVVAALGAAAYLLRGSFGGDPADQEKLWRICGNPSCGAEYAVLRSESKKAASERRQIPCPKCGSTEAAMAYACAHCQHATLAGAHGALPKVCKHCNQPFELAKSPGG